MKMMREFVTLVLVLGSAVWLRVQWSAIPAMVPVHYAADGLANRYGGKEALWALVGVSGFLYVLLSVIGKVVRTAKPRLPMSAETNRRMAVLSTELVGWVKLELALLFAYLIWASVQVAERDAGGLGQLQILTPVIAIAATVGIFMVRVMRVRRTAEGEIAGSGAIVGKD